jgi:hypothetical protein
MSPSVEYASYLIRLWREQKPQAVTFPSAWQAEVEHIQSGQCWSFGTFEELILFLRQQAEEPDIWRNGNGHDIRPSSLARNS